MLTPFPYQIEGANFLAERKTALLADDMGLGKTVQAILAAKRIGERVCVICPASLTSNWKAEFAKWWPDPPGGVYAISYDKALRLPDEGRRIFNGCTLILDESHYLKNPKAKRTKAVLGIDGIWKRAARVWCLTGTPAPNNPSEMWRMLRSLAPQTILKGETPMDEWAFTRRYCVTRNNGFGIEIVRGQRLDELRERIAPFVLRRRKSEVLKDLPPIRFGEIAFDTADCAKAMAELDPYTAVNLAAELEKHGVEALRRVGSEMATLRRITAEAKAPLLAKWAIDWLEATGEKLVVFGHHVAALAVVQEELARAGFGTAMIAGGTASVARGAEVRNFQENPKVRAFVGQIQAAGTGITLTQSSTLVFLEQSWVPAENMQAAMRIHRIGQRNGCLVQISMLGGSIDEAVQRALARKTEDLVKLGFMEEVR